jgi:hypothetical protein
MEKGELNRGLAITQLAKYGGVLCLAEMFEIIKLQVGGSDVILPVKQRVESENQ